MADKNSAVNITNSRFRASEIPWVYTLNFIFLLHICSNSSYS